MNLEEVVTHYGYIGILIGTFLEGETILIIAGFLAHRGYLELPFVIVAAFFGSLIGDQLYFYIGRFKGGEFIRKNLTGNQKPTMCSDYWINTTYYLYWDSVFCMVLER